MKTMLLYITWNPDIYAIRLGSWGIRWYSLCWLIGLLLGYLLMKYLYNEQGITWQKRLIKGKQAMINVFDPLFVYIFVGVLIGGRLGHCLFYQPDYFLSSWPHVVEMLLPIRLDEGAGWHFTGYEGLASHGGVIGMLIAIWLYHRATSVPVWTVLDNMGICSGITATFIRLGNLMNSEIVGKVTDLPWAFIFSRNDALPRHPGQLYEAIAYAIILCLIWLVYKKKGPKSVGTGFFFGLCLTLVFTARFIIEFTKDIQVDFESGMIFDMGQLLSLPFMAIGLACMAGGTWIVRLGAKPRKP